jgi:hypothetical protein
MAMLGLVAPSRVPAYTFRPGFELLWKASAGHFDPPTLLDDKWDVGSNVRWTVDSGQWTQMRAQYQCTKVEDYSIALLHALLTDHMHSIRELILDSSSYVSLSSPRPVYIYFCQ